jgi:hypothetical protein
MAAVAALNRMADGAAFILISMALTAALADGMVV